MSAKEYAPFERLTDKIKSPVVEVLCVRRENLVKSLIKVRNPDEVKRIQGAVEEIDELIDALTRPPTS